MVKPRSPRILRTIILVIVLIVGINVIYTSYTTHHPSSSSHSIHLRGFEDILSNKQKSDLAPLSSHLIMVPGHAVVKINQLANALSQDSAWYLLNYQLNQDFPMIIASHIRQGLQLLHEYPNATLILSGGQTRRDVGPLSEAASYYYVAMENKWINAAMNSRVFLEEFSRDSFENLLFSICRFKEVNGNYPSKISVVGFDFKADRYVSLHRKAIRFPLRNFVYYGVSTPLRFDHTKAVSGEQETLEMFEEDIYACSTEDLKQKRRKRNPFLRTIPYDLSCPELKDLLHWCGPDLFPGQLPWADELNQ